MTLAHDAYNHRLVDSRLDELMKELPAISVVGPRAVGKTTTLERRAATVVRLDHQAESQAFRLDPDGALLDLEEPILFDEWQNVPDVLRAVRRAVDAEWRPGRFLISGSVRAGFVPGVWPATGRIVHLPMYPMTVREQRGDGAGPGFVERLVSGERLKVPRDSPDLRGYLELAVRSGFPPPALSLDRVGAQGWLASYVDNLFVRDVEQLEGEAARSRDTRRMRQFFEAYALNTAGVVEQRTLYQAARISKVTATVYEDLLLDLRIADRVPAWTTNRLRRLTQQPKRYLVDAGLLPAVLEIDATGILRDGDLIGRVIETFVAAQIRPELTLSTSRARLHHLRTREGRQEVDLLIELAAGRVIAIEVKAAAAVKVSDARHLRWLRDQLGDRFVAGVVLHTGPYAFRLDERIVAAPISTLWG